MILKFLLIAGNIVRVLEIVLLFFEITSDFNDVEGE